jgi:superfamily I DNA and/or RNA helicase
MNSDLENKVEVLLKALETEKQYEVDFYKQNINQLSLNDRVKNQTTIYPLNYKDLKFTSFGEQLIEFENQMNYPKMSLGKTIEIFNKKNSIKGYIYKINSERFYVKTKSDERFFEWINKGKVGLTFLPDTKTYDTFLNELKSIRDTTLPHQINFIYNKNRQYHQSKALPDKKELNESQNQAIQQIINSDNPVELMHGPPGTGKTTTIAEAINLLTQKGKRILICSSTHIAIDNICQKLIDKNVNVCRIGNPIKVDDNIVNVTLENKAKNDNLFKVVEQLKKQADVIRKKAFKFKRNFDKSAYEERKQLKKELKDIKIDIGKIQKDIYKHTLESSDVVCGTFVGVLSELSSQKIFDYVFIDEASKAIEPAIWSVCKFANKMVLAGDHQQLPPFVQSDKAIQFGLNKSIFDVAQQNEFPMLLLNEQYRMNEKIMSFSNNYFYSSELIANKMVKDWHLTNETYEPIEFIDTAGCNFQETQENDNFGIYNLGEIDIIKKRIELLILENNNLVIISPYSLQVNWLKKEMSHLKSNSQLENYIGTIDSYQGQESDVIIISLVRSNDKGTIGFLKDYRRMNVAMTRAKKKLIIVGDSTTIGLDKFYDQLLEYIEQNGSYTSAWEYIY